MTQNLFNFIPKSWAKS